jgi:hypothetical protein
MWTKSVPFLNITSKKICISFPPALVWPSKHVQSNYFRCARSSVFNAWIISTLHAWTLNDDEEFSTLLSTEFEVLLAWRMDIRRLHWKALQTLWTVWRVAFLRSACCKTLPVSLSYSNQRLMFRPAGTVCPYTALTLPWSIGEQRACIETRSVQSENISHLSICNVVFHFWHLYLYWIANGWINNFKKKEVVRYVFYLDESVWCRLIRQACVISLPDYWYCLVLNVLHISATVPAFCKGQCFYDDVQQASLLSSNSVIGPSMLCYGREHFAL